MLRKCLRGAHGIFLKSAALIFAFNVNAEEIDNLMQTEIEHVVVLMLENRSFDNVLTWLYSQDDPPSYFIPDQSNFHFMGLSEDSLDQYTNVLTNSAGELVFGSPPIKGILSVAGSPFINSPKFDPYEPFAHVTKQIYGNGILATMSGFLQDYAGLWWEHEWASQKQEICAVMETYTEQELPVLYGLARHYAVSDLWFASVPTETNPNRAFSVCGTSEGQIANGSLGKSVFQSDTIWNRLEEESPDSTWTIFWQTDMIPGIIQGSYCKNTFAGLSRIPNLEDHFQKLDRFHELARKGVLPSYSFIEPQWTISIDLEPEMKLPPLILMGLQGNDFHPPGDVRTGENLVANIYTSLCANEEAWNKTLLVVTFDEHGGVFDHVPPPTAIPPDQQFNNEFRFDRYGVRVPTLFISPRIKKRTIIRSDDADIPFDHTSLIASILNWKKIEKSKWNMGLRVQSAPSFDGVITEREPREDSSLIPDTQSSTENQEIVCMGQPFYLRDQNGNYVAKAHAEFHQDAYLGSSQESVELQFVGGEGKITHGSFILIQSNDPTRGEANLLETSWSHCDCFYGENRHHPSQWWTIKSVDHPYVGSEIYYGDKVYLENHIYLDLFQQVPARLSQGEDLFTDFLKTKPITQQGESDYWIIEKSEE